MASLSVKHILNVTNKKCTALKFVERWFSSFACDLVPNNQCHSHLANSFPAYCCYMSTVSRVPESQGEITQQNQIWDIKREESVEEQINRSANGSYGANDDCNTSYHGHIPVLVKESLLAVAPEENQVIVDMTFGAGGHASHFLKSAANLIYIASDRDLAAYQKAMNFSSRFRKGQVIPVLSKFSELASQLMRLNIAPGSVDAFFMDLGASSMQFDTTDRGFSLSRDGPLDMRMDGERFPESPTAADVVNNLDPGDLGQIIKKYGEESRATEIAHAIVEARYAFGKFTRTSQLADVIKAVFNSSFRHDKLHRHAHVATKTFQALRIFVNDELNEINNGIEVARHFLRPGGRCVAIAFHSLEDRIVKRHFHDIDMEEKPNTPARYHMRNANVCYEVDDIKEIYLSGAWKPLSRKVVEAKEEEISRNPRARSAKLRAALKTEKL